MVELGESPSCGGSVVKALSHSSEGCGLKSFDWARPLTLRSVFILHQQKDSCVTDITVLYCENVLQLFTVNFTVLGLPVNC